MILVVDGMEQDDLPCLLSKESMKKVIIDIPEDKVKIFGKEVKLKENQAGHYIITLHDFVYGDKEWTVMLTGQFIVYSIIEVKHREEEDGDR